MLTYTLSTLLTAIISIASCSNDKDVSVDTTEDWRPNLYCPGDPSGACDNTSGPLQAGAAAVSISPTCFEDWIDANGDAEYYISDGDEFRDCGCDRLCPEDEGYEAPDEGENDEEFQAVWMAGFQNGRPAMEVHDDIWARAIVMRQGETTMALVVLTA